MQPSFFDYALEYQGEIRSIRFLSEMKVLIPFDAIEVIVIETGTTFHSCIDISWGTLFTELIHDRISFRKFLDIKDEDTIPDEATICKFRNASC